MMFLRYITVILLLTTTLILPGKELKVLMIGNSFSRSVYSYLPQLVNEEKTHKLVLTSAYIGDCALQQHYENIVKAEKDPDFKPYKMSVWKSQENPAGTRKSTDFSGNVNELLKSNQYDIITIQQRSVASVDHATYEPLFAQMEQDRTHITWHVADPAEFWRGATGRRWNYSDGTYPSYEDMMDQTYNVLDRHPHLIATFAHVMFLSEQPALLEELFAKYPNMAIDVTPGVEMYQSFNERYDFYRAFFEKYALCFA